MLMEQPMKAKKALFLVSILILSACFSITAYAAQWTDFTDVNGHWAEETLRRGFNDGLITGFEDNTLSPDSPITTAQMITVLCRVLGATETADISKLGISSDVWYADAAGKALRLGLISFDTGNLDKPMLRQDALSMIAKAFCLVPAEPDFAVLSSFSDSPLLSEKNRSAVAALVSKKLVTGFDGALNANGSISRAEFFTVLYRIAANYISCSALTVGTQGGSIIKGSGVLNYISAGNIWFDCTSEFVTLSGVKADALTLRSHKLSSLLLDNSSEITRLVIAVGSGNINLEGSYGYNVGSLQLESCTEANIGQNVGSIEITGSGMSVRISGKHDYLVITGSGNKITLSPGASFSELKVTGENNLVQSSADTFSLGVSCDQLELSGRGNTLNLSNFSETPSKVTIGGTENTISASFKSISVLDISCLKSYIEISSLKDIVDFSVTGSENKIKISSALAFSFNVSGSLNEISAKSDGGLGTVSATGNTNWLSLLSADVASVSISGNFNTVTKQNEGALSSLIIPGLNNTFVLYSGNELSSAEVSGANNTVSINGTAGSIIVNGRNTLLNGSGSVKNLNLNASGCTINLAAEAIADNSAAGEQDRVLELVTLGYEGNFTLEWAQTHDYESHEKEAWVNAKGYASDTRYLIWINLSMQRVNIFTGSKGDWTLIYSCIVGTGAPGRGTPVGTWKTTYKAWEGWTTSTYTVRPVVGFKNNTGYAFHSRLYRPGTTTLSDPSIGFPVSHGCVRMYDDDILYIYNNIPTGTTVVVF
ncbi:MAG: hypothetical protein EOM51_01840 [Clostridia bacterium]|nr:hypothetical protein [Clostridia bacterium]